MESSIELYPEELNLWPAVSLLGLTSDPASLARERSLLWVTDCSRATDPIPPGYSETGGSTRVPLSPGRLARVECL